MSSHRLNKPKNQLSTKGVRSDGQKSVKEVHFSLVNYYLSEAVHIHPYLYYVLELVQTLSLLWFMIHPVLGIYGDNSFLLLQIRLGLQLLNFYEFMGQGVSYQVLIVAALSYALIQVFLLVVSARRIKDQESQFNKYLRKVVTLQYLFLTKALSGPFIGLSIKIIYCDSQTPYLQGQQCYSAEHIFFCILAGILLMIVAYAEVIAGFLFFSKNPFDGSCLGYSNRNYMITKSILKIAFPTYFALNASLKLEFLFVIFAPVLWGIYIFLHRLNSIPSFNTRHFYVEYFLEAFLFWVAICGLISYYIIARPSSQPMTFFYILISAIILAFALIFYEQRNQYQFLHQCLKKKVKKQNLQRYVLSFINLLHQPAEEGRTTFSVNSLVLSTTLKSTQKVIRSIASQEGEQKVEAQTYEFLLNLVNQCLEQSSAANLKVIKCYLLRLLGFKFHSLHQLLQLQHQKLTIQQQFSLFYLLKAFDLTKEKDNDEESEMALVYLYQKKSGQLQELMEVCAENNLEYWEELGQETPSIPKLRGLATKYTKYAEEIAINYSKVKKIMPQNFAPSVSYLQFLLQVGVDQKATVRVRQILRQKLQNRNKVNNSLGKLGDQVCMIAVDSVGSRLGSIVNCNTQSKEMLGFDKSTLIGKNITRIMPKIYAQLHNNFILNYIHNKHNINSVNSESLFDSSMAQKFQKVVTPLNSNNYLLEMNLRLHLMNDIDSSLIVVGFMARTKDLGQGIVMVDAHNGTILAIDEKFSKMMKNKVTGLQIIQEEIRLSTLLPEINLTLLAVEGHQDSQLEIGHFSESDDLMQEVKGVSVRVQVRRTKLYQGNRITFLSIMPQSCSIKPQPLIKLVNRRQSSSFMKIPNIQILQPQPQPPKDQSRIQSISCSQVTTFVQSANGDEHNRNTRLTRKLDQLIKQKKNQQSTTSIRICYTFIIICMVVYLTTGISLRLNYLSRTEKMYINVQLMADLPYQQAQINLYVNKVWCVVTYHNFTTRAPYYQPLIASIDSLTSKYAQVVKEISLQNYPLEYNLQTKRNYSIFKVQNGTVGSALLSMTFNSAIKSYINSARKMQNPATTDALMSIDKYLVQQEAYYITVNGDYLIPAIGIQAVAEYTTYFRYLAQHQIRVNTYLKAGLVFLGLVCLVGVVVLGRSLNRVQGEVYRMHSRIRLWDIGQLAGKSHQFLQKRGKSSKKPRSSGLLKIFPATTFVNIIENTNKKIKTLVNVNQQDDQQENLNQNNQLNQENQISKTKDASVNIQWQENHRTALLVISLVVIAASVVMGLSMFFQYQTAGELSSRFQITKNLGVIRKCLTYLNLFAYRIVSIHPVPEYAQKISPEAIQFYQYSNLLYNQIGNSVLKEVYGTVQILQANFANSNSYPLQYLRDLYDNKISIVMQKSCDMIVNLDKTQFQPAFLSVVSADRTREVIFTLLLAFLCFLLILLIHCLYIRPIQLQRRQTINMLKVLPTWLIERNPTCLTEISS